MIKKNQENQEVNSSRLHTTEIFILDHFLGLLSIGLAPLCCFGHFCCSLLYSILCCRGSALRQTSQKPVSQKAQCNCKHCMYVSRLSFPFYRKSWAGWFSDYTMLNREAGNYCGKWSHNSTSMFFLVTFSYLECAGDLKSFIREKIKKTFPWPALWNPETFAACPIPPWALLERKPQIMPFTNRKNLCCTYHGTKELTLCLAAPWYPDHALSICTLNETDTLDSYSTFSLLVKEESWARCCLSVPN